MASSPEIVRRQGYNTDGSADPIVCEAAEEERPVAAIVLDHEEADEEPRRRYYEQQANRIAMVYSHPYQSPNDKEGHNRDHEFEHSARIVRLAITGEQVRQRTGVW
jgi:hypothetical protein